WAIQEMGYEAIIINSNPETVSTDFSISDKLYFEPLTFEDVMNVIDIEKPIGVIAQFGGQTALNLVEPLLEQGVNILGTSSENINAAEDRKLFEKLLKDLDINQPKGQTIRSLEAALETANTLKYPVLIRPSFVLGGRAMEIIYNDQDLKKYVLEALETSEHPILIDKYLQGKECEVDALCDGERVLIPGIMEHIEAAGVHSGDSMAVYPPYSIDKKMQDLIYEYTKKIALGLNVIGVVNIQFIIFDNNLYVIEVNPRGSRTLPFLSKITKLNIAKIATNIMLGKSLKDQNLEGGIYPHAKLTHVKAPVFSFTKLSEMKIQLSPEMKSTGEVMGSDLSLSKAIYKTFLASGTKIPELGGKVFLDCATHDKDRALEVISRCSNLGFDIFIKPSLKKALEDSLNNFEVYTLEPKELTTDFAMIACVDTTQKIKDSLKTCQFSLIHQIPLFTSFDTLKAILDVIEWKNPMTLSIQDSLFDI
ncbi:MAG: ATP-grasp domain-containing protein, partial [Psittacicella sp.]